MQQATKVARVTRFLIKAQLRNFQTSRVTILNEVEIKVQFTISKRLRGNLGNVAKVPIA